MWRRLVSPEMLFFAGTAQAMIPYVMWAMYGPNLSYSYRITYLPLIYWWGGFLAFVIGARLVRRLRRPRPLVLPNRRTLAILMLGVMGLLVVVIRFMIGVYGGIPLLQFRQWRTDVELYELANQSTRTGVLAILLVFLFVLSALTFCYVAATPKPRWRDRLFVLAALGVELFGTTFAGKRQGLVIAVVFFSTAMVLLTGHPMRRWLEFFKIPGARPLANIAVIALPLVVIFVFGAVAAIRNLGEARLTGTQQALTYVQYPIINFEEQAEEVGLGPAQFSPVQLLRYLVPHRLFFRPDGRELFPARRPRPPEPTSPTSFYGELQWNLGLFWSMVFAMLTGFLCRYAFEHSRENIFWLLSYAHWAWALFACHTYNHFLNLNFIPLPTFFFLLIGLLARRPRRLRRAPMRAQPQPRPVPAT